MSLPLLKISKLSKNIAGLEVIKDLSLTTQKGEILAIIGPNGAGKTTLINIITGFQKATKGEITFENSSILGLKPYLLAQKKIVRTFQNLALVSELTVRENLQLPFLSRAIAENKFWNLFKSINNKVKPQTRDNLKQWEIQFQETTRSLELETYLDKTVNSIPYGIRKKVELAKALLLNPKLLILDEPVAGLNLKEKEFIHHFIQEIKTKMQLSLIITEHNLEFLRGLSDKVLVIDHGKVIFLGPFEKALKDPGVIKSYLGKIKK